MKGYLSRAKKKKKLSIQNSIPSRYIFQKMKGKMKNLSDKQKHTIHCQQTCTTRKKKVKGNYLGRRNILPDRYLDLHKETEVKIS